MRNLRTSLAVACSVACSVVVLLASGCSDGSSTSAGGSSTAAPASGVTPGSSGPATDQPQPGGAGRGCPADDGGVPDGARRKTYTDLDGDARSDTLFLTDAPPTLGVKTHSGATFSTPLTLPETSGVAATPVRTDESTALVVLRGSQQAYLFAVVDCQVVVTRNAEGSQYTFDLGYTTPGTGVGCVSTDKGTSLLGLKAVRLGEQWVIEQTVIDISDGGATARAGAVSTGPVNLTKDQAFERVDNGFTCVPDAATV